MKTPYISLKFGIIKSVDFKNNEESEKIYNTIHWSDSDDERTKKEVEVIKSYNGFFYAWWDGKYISKNKAIKYLQDYNHLV